MSEPSVAVVIPWRSQLSRLWAHDVVVNIYKAYFPHYDIIEVDTFDTPFNLSACRNKGVFMAQDTADVVIINDADTIPEKSPIERAIELALEAPGVVTPYTEYRSLKKEGTQQFKTGTQLRDCRYQLIDNACSGIYVTTPQSWWSHGGQDERFRGWGYEDAAWEVAHKTLLGEPRVVPGRVFSCHHSSQIKEGSHYAANAALCYRYTKADDDIWRMKELVGEWWDDSPYSHLNPNLVHP